MYKKIVLIGGPSTGKSSTMKALESRGFYCMPEVSREVTLQAQKEGIEQLFLTEPLLFSEKLLQGREQQFLDSQKLVDNHVFFDRGIPSVEAYLRYAKTDYPPLFTEKSKQYRYDNVFYFPVWDEIYESDNERYENLEQAKEIEKYIYNNYLELGYKIIKMPFMAVQERCDFILEQLNF